MRTFAWLRVSAVVGLVMIIGLIAFGIQGQGESADFRPYCIPDHSQFILVLHRITPSVEAVIGVEINNVSVSYTRHIDQIEVTIASAGMLQVTLRVSGGSSKTISLSCDRPTPSPTPSPTPESSPRIINILPSSLMPFREGEPVVLDIQTENAQSLTVEGIEVYRLDRSPLDANHWTFTFVPLDGPVEYSLTFTAHNGDRTSPQSYQAIIENVPPTATFTSNVAQVLVGETFVLGMTTPADVEADLNAGFRYRFDCDGDGSFEQVEVIEPSFECPAFSSPGQYIVTGQIVDKDDGVSEYSQTITVVDPTPVLTEIRIVDTDTDQVLVSPVDLALTPNVSLEALWSSAVGQEVAAVFTLRDISGAVVSLAGSLNFCDGTLPPYDPANNHVECNRRLFMYGNSDDDTLDPYPYFVPGSYVLQVVLYAPDADGQYIEVDEAWLNFEVR